MEITSAVAVLLTVRFYHSPGTDRDLPRALTEASAIMRAAGVEVRWIDCAPSLPPPATASPCAVPPARDEMVLRLVDRGPSPAWRFGRTTLGSALVAEGGASVLATVYLDGVSETALRARLARFKVLARAIAHEVGHLLLGRRGHSPRGLMRETWPTDEFRRDAPTDRGFAPDDAARRAETPCRP